jgi:hypothetical protein
MAITIHELATLCGATMEGNDTYSNVLITAANDIAAAQAGQVTQLTHFTALRRPRKSIYKSRHTSSPTNGLHPNNLPSSRSR